MTPLKVITNKGEYEIPGDVFIGFRAEVTGTPTNCVELTLAQKDLLAKLSARRGEVVFYKDLSPSGNKEAIHTQVSRTRQILKLLRSPEEIVTVQNKGYRLL